MPLCYRTLNWNKLRLDHTTAIFEKSSYYHLREKCLMMPIIEMLMKPYLNAKFYSDATWERELVNWQSLKRVGYTFQESPRMQARDGGLFNRTRGSCLVSSSLTLSIHLTFISTECGHVITLLFFFCRNLFHSSVSSSKNQKGFLFFS